MSKLEFKEFVKKHPNLIKQVENGNTTWQKLYEIFDLYGENNDVLKKYLVDDKNNLTNNSLNLGNNFKELINMFKGIDLNTIQKGLSNLDKAIDAFKDILPTKEVSNLNNYEPRPTYKYFED